PAQRRGATGRGAVSIRAAAERTGRDGGLTTRRHGGGRRRGELRYAFHFSVCRNRPRGRRWDHSDSGARTPATGATRTGGWAADRCPGARADRTAGVLDARGNEPRVS